MGRPKTRRRRCGDEIKPSVRRIRDTFLFLGTASVRRRAWHPCAALFYPGFYRLDLGGVELYVGGSVEAVLHAFPVQVPTTAHVRNRCRTCVIVEHLPRVIAVRLQDPFLWHVRRTRKAGQAHTHRQTQIRQTDRIRTDGRRQNRQTQSDQTRRRQKSDKVTTTGLRRTSEDTDETNNEQQRSQFAVVEDDESTNHR
jgi:hypothetical protein